MAAATPEREILELIEALNADGAVSGILVQLPLPDGIDEGAVLAAVDPAKDVDGFHAVNIGRLWSGTRGLVPCTPFGCLTMLKETVGELKGLRAMVVGRSNIVGKPMAALLLGEPCPVTIAHSTAGDLAERCPQADILGAPFRRAERCGG